MKYIEEYLNDVIKVKPLGKLTTKDDELNGMSGEMVYIDGKCSDIFISHADYANWLEKQSEQRPIDYNKELKKCRENPLYFFDKYVKLKLKKPVEWSEEDETEFNHVIKVLKSVAEEQETKGYNNLISSANWLKSLKDRYTWKPSDEQIKALKNAISIKPFENPSDSLLWGLYEQLKKLKEK